jgi:hypothetical protein
MLQRKHMHRFRTLMSPINPTPRPYLRVTWIQNALYRESRGRVYPVEGYYDTCWLTGLWPTQAKVEGILLKAAWHWGSDSGVVNNPLGEQGCTP